MKKIFLIAALLILSGCSAETEVISRTADNDIIETTAETVSDNICITSQIASAPITVPAQSNTQAETSSATEAVTEDTQESAAQSNADTAKEGHTDEAADLSNKSDSVVGELNADYLLETGTASGDIIEISVGADYIDHSVEHGNIKFLEDESTSTTLYFQGIKQGADNITITENSAGGVIIRSYAVKINEDLSVEIFVNNNNGGSNVPMPLPADIYLY